MSKLTKQYVQHYVIQFLRADQILERNLFVSLHLCFKTHLFEITFSIVCEIVFTLRKFNHSITRHVYTRFLIPGYRLRLSYMLYLGSLL